MDNKAKYLRVTMHDNDYTYSLQLVAKALNDIFSCDGWYPTEEHFPALKESIKHLWASMKILEDLMWREENDNPIDYLNPHLEFVDFFDIPDNDNYENVYIPMFPNAEILVR